MSEENIEIARRYLEENFPAPEQLSEWVAGFFEADADYYPARKIPAAWEDFRIVVEEARAVGDDRVLVRGEIRAEGRASGVALEGDNYSCFWLRNGRFFRVEGHLTLAGALRALGLSGDSLEAARVSE